jgi:hypothetical protein
MAGAARFAILRFMLGYRPAGIADMANIALLGAGIHKAMAYW